MDPRGTGFGVTFIIFAVAAGATIPSVGAFHHPSLWKRDKAKGTFRAFLHFDPPPGPMLVEPCVQGMIVKLRGSPETDFDSRYDKREAQS